MKAREEELRAAYRAAYDTYRNRLDAWEAQRKKILNRKKSMDEQTVELDALGPKPQPPLNPMLVCSEPTFEGMVKLLLEGQPSIGIFASEGGAFVGGHGFSEESKLRTAAGYSQLWDSGSTDRVRAGDGALAVNGKRVAMHLLVQPDVAQLLLTDAVLLDQGFLSRILFIRPPSTMGQRFWRDASPEDELALQEFDALLRRELPLKDGTRNELSPRALRMSPEARIAWIAFADEVEAKLGAGSEFVPISGLAAKLPEHAARFAAILIVFANPDASEIGVADMTRGITLARFFALEALRLHGFSRSNEKLVRAQRLLDWLHDHWGEPWISIADICQFGPYPFRNVDVARSLMAILSNHGHARASSLSRNVRGKNRREVFQILGGNK